MSRKFRLLMACGVVAVLGPSRGWAEAPAAAVSVFNSYVGTVEGRLAEQHRSAEGFLAGAAGEAAGEERLRRGEVIVEQMTAPEDAELPGAMLHHWRGTAFATGAKAANFEQLLRDFGGYPKTFAPQVMEARTTASEGDRVTGWMRVRERHGITVVLDSTYDVRFGRPDARNGWSASRSVRIAEVDDAGTSRERMLSSTEDHGFLWRMNTYWSWQERDGGLYLQVESVSLTRGIPVGLGWAVRPFVESIPRESLEFTLKAARNRLLGTDRR
ncbi:MAG TPA: hypothetical protein VHZ25_19540 [Acidobacteriaceae bacterium]|jgi:hypothetical protein|nr:hypothetical protein [Acidobacteriaceae bacterium]